jgi:hypothetical protein
MGNIVIDKIGWACRANLLVVKPQGKSPGVITRSRWNNNIEELIFV